MVEGEHTQDVRVARFKAFAMSLGSISLLIVALFTSWAYVRAVGVNDGLVWDIWNLKFSGNLLNGVQQGFSEGYVNYLATAVFLLLGTIILQILVAASLERSKIIVLSSKVRISMSFASVGIAVTLLVYIMYVLPDQLGFPAMFSSVEGYLRNGADATISTDPGIAWFTLIFAILAMVLEGLMLLRLHKVDEVKDEENTDKA